MLDAEVSAEQQAIVDTVDTTGITEMSLIEVCCVCSISVRCVAATGMEQAAATDPPPVTPQLPAVSPCGTSVEPHATALKHRTRSIHTCQFPSFAVGPK